MQSTTGQPCDICGDIGFTQLIVTCSYCHQAREHIYCMHPNLSSVPESWFCRHDNCHLESPIQCKQEVEPLSRRESVCVTGNASSKKPDATKMLLRHCTGAKPGSSSLQSDMRTQTSPFSSNLVPAPKAASLGNDHVYKSTGHPEDLTVGKVQTSTSQKQHHELSQPLPAFKSSLSLGESLTTENFESAKVITTKSKLLFSGEARCSPLTYNRPLVYGVKEKSQTEKKMLEVDNQAGKISSLLPKDCVTKDKPADTALHSQENDRLNSKHSFKFVEGDLPNPPAVNALWKGSFTVLGLHDELYDGVEAYPPRRLSRKVCLVLKEMPKVLQFKLKPRPHIWPKTFQRESPTVFDIALYFWPGSLCRSREKYNHLMERMVEKDLCMVSRLNGTELLIFTSSQLPVESQILNKQFYLWGVFITLEERHSYDDLKGKQAVNIPLPSSKIGEDLVTSNYNDDPVMEMRIDMARNKDAGSVDICSRKNSKVACWESSGFPSQDAVIRMHSDCSRFLHQAKRERHDDFDVSPGFERQVALEGKHSSVDSKGKQYVSNSPVLNSNTHDHSAGVFGKIDDHKVDMDADIVGGKYVGSADICLRCNSMGECLHTSDIPSQGVFAKINLDQSSEENATVMRLHHTQIEQCHFDTISISRSVAIDAGDKGPIPTSLMTMPSVHCKQDTSPGISKSTKLGDKVDYFCQKQRFNPHQQEGLMQQAPLQKQEIMIQQALVQKQQQSMYRLSLLPSAQVQVISSKSHPSGFHQPGNFPSSKVEPILNRNLQKSNMAGNEEVGSVDTCARFTSKGSSWDKADIPSRDAFTRMRSDPSRYLHQTKRERTDDFDVPPGFRRHVASEGKNSAVDVKWKQQVSDEPVLNSDIQENSAHVTDKIDDHGVDMDIDMVGGKDVGNQDMCLGSDSLNECLDNSDIPCQEALATVHSDRSRYSHQTKRECPDDFDVPPGFRRQVAMQGNNSSVDLKRKQPASDAPVLHSEIHEDSVGAFDKIDDHHVDMDADLVGPKDVGEADISLGSNSMAECLDNSDIHSQDVLAGVSLDQSTEENVTVMQVHQTRIEQCDIGASRISKPVTTDAADKESAAASLKTASPAHHRESASLEISESSKLAEEDSLAKKQEEVLMQQSSIQKQKVGIQQAPQQQEQSMHQPALLPSLQIAALPSGNLPGLLPSEVEVTPDVNLRPGFVQPVRLLSSTLELIPNGNLQPGFVQPGPLASSKVELIPNGNLLPDFDQPGFLQSSLTKTIQSRNLSAGVYHTDSFQSENVTTVLNQHHFPESPRMEANHCRNLSHGFYQTEPIQSGNVTPVFYQPNVLHSLHTELIPSGNLYPGSDTSRHRSVYVSNIPLQVTKPLFQNIFEICGAVEGCMLAVKGEYSYGFVNYFDYQSAADAVLSLNGKQLFGQPIEVSWALEPLPRGAFNIYVGNLCPQVTDVHLFAFFSVFPSCLAARVMRDQTYGWSKLYGFVSFGNQQEAQNAIYNFNGKWLGSRQIKCNWATKTAGSSDIHRHWDAVNVMELTSGTAVDGRGYFK